MTHAAAPPEHSGVWATLRREGRVYWGRRWRWLGWLVAVTVALAGTAALLARRPDTVEATVATAGAALTLGLLGGLHCWISAWLGSDLLSPNRPNNTEPLRHPTPRELLLRLLGRLAPWYGAVILALGSLLWPIAGLFMHRGTGPSRWTDAPNVWAALLAWILSSGLPYAGATALASGLFRRPRRWLATASVVVAGSGLLALLMGGAAVLVNGNGGNTQASFPGDAPPAVVLVFMVTIPNLVIGQTWSLLVTQGLTQASYRGASPATTAHLAWTAALFFAMLTLLTWSAWLAVTRVRHRRSRWVTASEGAPLAATESSRDAP
jgi:hypothetical protein